jgi:hypothetical protein
VTCHGRFCSLISVAWLVAACPDAAVAQPHVTAAAPRPPIVESPELAIVQPPAIAVIGGARHLVYELHITNLGDAPIALTGLAVIDAARGTILREVGGAALAADLGRPGPTPPAGTLTTELAPGTRAVFYAWLPLGDAPAPAALRHRVEIDVMRGAAHDHRIVFAGPVRVRAEPPVVLGAPLRGGRWVAIYDPAGRRSHRRVIYTVDGRARIPARFAIDWMKLGDDDALAVDPARLASWYGYAADVLAVADATVADARDDIAVDTPPAGPHPPVALEAASGNYVVLDLGAGRFAIYEHLKPGSVRVRPGARVRRGDVIAALGNTGSSSGGPHLHFHVADAAADLAAEGLPYAFDAFEVVGAYRFAGDDGQPARVVPAAPLGRLRAQLPAPNAVVRF